MTQHAKSGVFDVNGEPHMRNAQGHLIPKKNVRAQDELQDELVRKMIGFAEDLSDQVARFKGHCFEDVNDFLGLLSDEYGETRGGAKGNMTFTSFDGTLKVTVQVAEHFDYGPELQIAKGLVDECLTEWSASARPELRTIVERAFNTDKEGKINRAELLSLKKLEIDDDRWKRAMRAITDAERAIGSKTYMRFYKRPHGQADWTSITIDMAKAEAKAKPETVEQRG
ncbi:sulfate transporter [Sagittula sp. P11]|uniref:DUF3164 family protein n=1 Tax=Sagittula sp. P11 TaxID=2009329 RepID=UPI000C2D5CC2|nr:DUF3164 family protein [Sagittula sp. P11]AUC54264.1 sulfate transporter [Sagittula sp. P11]